MPQTVAQYMGILVTGLVVLGTDLDVLYAVPLGIFAGALTIFFASFPSTIPNAWAGLRRGLATLLSSFTLKRRTKALLANKPD